MKKNKKPRKFSIVRLFVSLLFLGLFCVLGVVVWCARTFPDLAHLNNNVRRPSVTVQSEDGEVIGTFGDLHEDTVSAEDLPQHVIHALMAVEDRRFFYHFGVDVLGLARAFFTNYQAGRIVQGGSTVTQQLAKNILTTQGTFSVQDRSLERKIQEALLALWLESRFSKMQILTLYLNRVYFGAGTFGIDAASRRYFDKSAKELSVFEAAVLAGLLKAPSRYSPSKNIKRATDRATVVLKTMVEAGFLKDYKDHLEKGIKSFVQQEHKEESHTRYFADWIYEALPSILGPLEKDIVVITTLDSRLQKKLFEAVEHNLQEHGKELKVNDAAALMMTPQGAVKAMIGGRDYASNQFNCCTQSRRQSGSAFKTIVFAAYLEKTGASLSDMIEDTPFQMGDWAPKNYKYKAKGSVSLREAMAFSVNTVAVRLAQRIGIDSVLDMAQRLGITDDLHPDLSLALGTGETTLLDMTTVYATFANEGKAVWPYGVLEIRDRDGAILYQHKDEDDPTYVVSQTVNQQMVELLRGVVEYGYGKAANVSPYIYGKTGSNGDRDAWFFGFYLGETQDYAFGFWVGNQNNQDMNPKSTGGRLPTWMARDVLKSVVEEDQKAAQNASTQPTSTIDSLIDGEDQGEKEEER